MMKIGGIFPIAFLCACLQACGPEAGAQSVHETSIADLQRMLASGEVTSVRLVEQYLARIEAYDRARPRLHSIVRVNPAARENAAGHARSHRQLAAAGANRNPGNRQ